MNGLTFPFSNMLNMYMSFKLEFNVGAAMAADERSAKIFILNVLMGRFFHFIARVNFHFGKKFENFIRLEYAFPTKFIN